MGVLTEKVGVFTEKVGVFAGYLQVKRHSSFVTQADCVISVRKSKVKQRGFTSHIPQQLHNSLARYLAYRISMF